MQIRCLPLMLLGCLLIATPSAGQTPILQVGDFWIEAASTDCLNGLRAFVVAQKTSSPALYIFDDEELVYSNYEDVGAVGIDSIICTKYGIVMPGYSPAYSIAPALILEDGKLLIKPLGGVKGHIEVWTSSTSTVVAGFEDADTDSDEDGVQSQAELKNVFAIPPDAVKMMLVVAAKYTLRDVSGQEALTALSSCWHEEGGISYDVAAYTIEKKDGGMVDIITGDDKRTTTETLPFVATNSICQRGETYLFGRNGGTPAAAKISYEPQTKRFTLERIDPKDAPLQPYFGEIRE